jgi:Uri superfamily endonuclease
MKGVYLLLIRVSRNLTIRIGSLGKINFDKGLYAYVGSAQKNLEKRLKRHLLKTKKKFWHIDYLLNNKFTKIIKLLYKNSGKNEECKIANKLSKTEIAIPNFGSSDCNCRSHLFSLKNMKNISKLEMRKL